MTKIIKQIWKKRKNIFTLKKEYQVKMILRGYMKLKNKKTKKIQELNSDKELTELKKTIFDEAVNVRLDYEQNPNEDSGSLIIIHQNSEYLEEE